jgi:hypothetical protein
MDKHSSDERLLKLIEGQYDPKAEKPMTFQNRKAAGKKNSVKPSLQGLVSGLKLIRFDLFSINKALVVPALFLTVIFFYAIFTPPGASKSRLAMLTSSDVAQVEKLISAGQEKLGAGMAALRQDIKRDFFLPPGVKQAENALGQSPDFKEELKSIKLVGIIWSSEPEVMIENEKDLRTYILKKGDSFGDLFKVKNISRNSALLEVATRDGPRDYDLR